jgi:hypothetical protein
MGSSELDLAHVTTASGPPNDVTVPARDPTDTQEASPRLRENQRTSLSKVEALLERPDCAGENREVPRDCSPALILQIAAWSWRAFQNTNPSAPPDLSKADVPVRYLESTSR